MAEPRMVKVKAVTEVRDNGVLHAPGETFEMEASLVEPHRKAGQIELAEKQQATPRDKQVTGGKDK